MQNDRRRQALRLPGLIAIVLGMPVVASPSTSEVSVGNLPAFECASTGTLRVTCRGQLVDGRPAHGITVRVYDRHNRVVFEDKVGPMGKVTFRKPDAQFHVVFDAGNGNVLTILGSEMT